jgi:hypothetical protein
MRAQRAAQPRPPAPGPWPLLFLLLLATPLHADIRYSVDYLLPRGGARGATVSVEFHGVSLENPKEIVFYQPGIKASDFVPYAKPGDGFKVKFFIAPDCPLGEHVLRVRTATSLTDAVTFWVSPFPTVYESESKIGEDDTIEKARPIPMNVTVEGQILPGPDMDKDVYRVQAEQGQRISVEVEAARLGTLHFQGELDLCARILDSTGKELARSDDSALFVQDPFLSIIAPRAGAYFVEIKQQIFYQPRQAWYRAHIGTFSRPTAIFPAGGPAGSTIAARILGDPAGERTEQISLPEQPGPFPYFSGGAPSPNTLRVSPYPNVMPGDPVAQLPAAFNGIIEKPGDVQTFHFIAKKNQSWKIQVFARTLGAPVDPKICLRSVADPKHLVDADDARLIDLGQPSARGTWHTKDQLDPIAVFKAPADGEYILGVEDTTGAGGPDHVFRVEVEPLQDTIYTHISTFDGVQMARLAALEVPQGGRWTLDVQLAQGFGNTYKGDIELEARGLPPGVTMIAPRYLKGAPPRMPIQFVAAPDAEPQAALIELLARPVDPKVKLHSESRQGIALTNRPGELPWHYVFLDKYALAVTQPAPFDIELVQPEIGISQNSELLLAARITRHGDFKGPIEIQPDWLPDGISKEAVVTIPKDKTEAVFKIQASDKARPATYKIAMNACTTDGDSYSGVGRIRVSSQFIDLKVTQPYLTIDLQRTSVERGKEAVLVGVLHQNKAFPGKAAITLRQLPKGVKMREPAPTITAKDKEVIFHLTADTDALAGLYKGIGCEVSITEEGQTIRQHTGSGILRIDAPITAGGSR